MADAGIEPTLVSAYEAKKITNLPPAVLYYTPLILEDSKHIIC